MGIARRAWAKNYFKLWGLLPAEVRARRLADRRSILDSVQGQVRSILGTVGGADRRKLDEYLTAVREIEAQIQAAEHNHVVEVTPDFEKPDGVPFEYAAYAKIMFDLAATAFQADVAFFGWTALMFQKPVTSRTA